MPTLARTWRLNHTLRDAQNVCTLTKVGTVLKSISQSDQDLLAFGRDVAWISPGFHRGCLGSGRRDFAGILPGRMLGVIRDLPGIWPGFVLGVSRDFAWDLAGI